MVATFSSASSVAPAPANWEFWDSTTGRPAVFAAAFSIGGFSAPEFFAAPVRDPLGADRETAVAKIGLAPASTSVTNASGGPLLAPSTPAGEVAAATVAMVVDAGAAGGANALGGLAVGVGASPEIGALGKLASVATGPECPGKIRSFFASLTFFAPMASLADASVALDKGGEFCSAGSGAVGEFGWDERRFCAVATLGRCR